jgi:threonine dehydratase
MSSVWPIDVADVRAARERLSPYLSTTPLRQYAALDAAVGHGITVLVKHENHQPTNSFKARNGLAAMTAMTDAQLGRGVLAATRGNHGQGVALAGRLLGTPVTICVPHGNNPEKNEAMVGLGATLIEEGCDYDETLVVAEKVKHERGLTMVHSTNDPNVIAGAGTITLEIVEQEPELDAIVVAVGGGSQTVGALTVLRELKPSARVYAVQAEGAAAIYESWKAKKPLTIPTCDTFADGIATRSAYEMTFPPMLEGLAGFVTVSDAQIAEAMRLLMRTSHNLVEPAGAAGLAGVFKLRAELAGKKVAVILTGGNVDAATLRRVVEGQI